MMNNIIGVHVRYFDYLGLERFGTVVACEPYHQDPSVVYLYIADEETEFNIHRDVINGTEIVEYAEIRLSTEINLDDRQ